MSKEMIINSNEFETRIAFLDEGRLAGFYIERTDESAVMGNIYTGRVMRVLPGMQAAFVDVGLERTAYLHVADASFDQDFFENREGEADYTDYIQEMQPIENILTEGQEILAQVTREPLGNKGARITTYLSLPGMNLVLMPTSNHVGISRRIKNEGERERLRAIIERLRKENHGIIARTAAEGKDEDELRADYEYLVRLWETIRTKRSRIKVPELIHRDVGVALRTIRFLYSEDTTRIVVDSRRELGKIKEFMDTVMPGMSYTLELYTREEPIFDFYGIEKEIEKMLQKKVWLKSGGYLIIEEDEAFCAIDVNTGKYVGKHTLEDTTLKINLEAVKEIAHQLRVRNIGGIVIVDFIDMEILENREKVFLSLLAELEKDRNKTSILKISELGLIEMTRQRIGKSLREILCESCPYCSGHGVIKTAASVSYDICRELEREALRSGAKVFSVLVHPDVAAVLLDERKGLIEKTEKRLKKRIDIHVDTGCHREHFEIVTPV